MNTQYVVKNDDYIAYASIADMQKQNYDSDAEIFAVDIIDVSAEYDCSDGEISVVTVTAKIGNKKVEKSFTVQLDAGEYLPQNGCWIMTNAGDYDFDKIEHILFSCVDVAHHAEASAREFENENYTYHDAGFNCAINSNTLRIRENRETGECTLQVVNESHNSADYSSKFKNAEIFENYNNALEFLKKYRTGDYQDCRGLYSYLNDHE